MTNWAARLQSWLPLPAWCYGCHAPLSPSKEHPFLCAACIQGLPHWDPAACFHCGHFHETGDCLEEWSFHLDFFEAGFYYREPLIGWMGRFKYGPNPLAGRVLRTLTADWLEDRKKLWQDSLLIPIPSHLSKVKARGFNSASFLLNFPAVQPQVRDWLIKIQNAPNQASLDRDHRLQNLVGAFAASGKVENQRIILFDDVCTTGRTLDEAARTLKRAGAKEVGALSLCRTIH